MSYALLALSYLIGATPTSYWVGRVSRGIDLREHGSGNLGATNAFRILGWRWALPVVVVDIAKGFLPVWLFPALTGVGLGWSLLFGTAAILGHMFSFWVGFRGGKGVATSAGVFLALTPLAVLGAFVVWTLVTFLTRYVSLGSISAAVALPALIVFTTPAGEGGTVLVFATALSAFVVWKHRTNIGRLIAGQENRFGAGIPGSEPTDVALEEDRGGEGLP